MVTSDRDSDSGPAVSWDPHSEPQWRGQPALVTQSV